ncbi:serine hydrolase-like protein 2 [Amblyomma americanum]
MIRITAALRSTKLLHRCWSFSCHAGVSQCRESSGGTPLVEREIRELQIPVPYGHLAAKQWLPTSAEDPHRRVLLLHGFQDNASSFDDVVPRLDPRWHAVALDFTGHGLSSHLPRGVPYMSIQFWFDVCRAAEYLGWTQFSIIGHSLGGHVGLHFGCMFPEKLQNLVMIDALGPIYEQASRAAKVFRGIIEGNMRLEQKDLSRPPVYTEEQLIKLYTEKTAFGYLPDNVRTLMKRGCKSVGDGRYVLTKDARLKYIHWIRSDSAALKEYCKGYNNNLLALVAIPGFGGSSAKRKIVSDALAQSCRTFKIIDIEGNHHLHMSFPDTVAGHIRSFLDPQ